MTDLRAELAEVLSEKALEATRALYEADWIRRDLFQVIVEAGLTEEVEELTGIGHRTIEHHARTARETPPDQRDHLYAPSTHSRMRKDRAR